MTDPSPAQRKALEFLASQPDGTHPDAGARLWPTKAFLVTAGWAAWTPEGHLAITDAGRTKVKPAAPVFRIAILINDEWCQIATSPTRMWADDIAQALADTGDYWGVQVQQDGAVVATFTPRDV